MVKGNARFSFRRLAYKARRTFGRPSWKYDPPIAYYGPFYSLEKAEQARRKIPAKARAEVIGDGPWQVAMKAAANPKRKNALFSFTRAMLPGHLRQPGAVSRRKRIAWDRLSREKRRRVAIAAGVSERIADVWAKIRWRDIPEGWHDALISNLGAARNPMKKKKKRKPAVARPKKRNVRRSTKTARRTRRKQNSRRRRNRTVSFPFPVTPGQKKKLKGFLNRLTGKRIRIK